MSVARRFEDLIAWQRARALTRAIYTASGNVPFRFDYHLVQQIRRASVSSMSNVAEGFERFRPKEFRQFLLIAKASCAEVRSLLYVAQDAGHLDQQTLHRLQLQANEVTRILGGLVGKVKGDRRSSAL